MNKMYFNFKNIYIIYLVKQSASDKTFLKLYELKKKIKKFSLSNNI